jgi:TetR/AcrR family transcriptional repressor of nem operon
MTKPHLDKRSQLVQAAVKLVYLQGFHPTTLAEVAQEAQVPLGNVYYYFKTKEAIGQALVEHYLGDYRTRRQNWEQDPDPKHRVESFIQLTFDNRQFLAQSGCPIGTLCGELHKQDGLLAEQASQIFAEVLAWLEIQFRAMGRVSESKELAIHLLAALEGVALLAHTFHSPDYVVGEVNRLKEWVRSL